MVSVSVVMPTFNEEGAIEKVVEDIRRHTSAHPTEILIVDSSSDRTAEIAKRLGVRVIAQKPQGHGIALRAAIQNASGDIVITADCDNTYPMEKIPELVRLITEEGYDLVSCNRLTRELTREMPLSNRLANMAFAAIVRLLYRIPTHDVTTGMFAMKKSIAHGIPWETNYSFPAEIIIRSNLAKCRYVEVPIAYKLRIGEVTLNKWRSGKAYLRCFAKYRFFPGMNLRGM